MALPTVFRGGLLEQMMDRQQPTAQRAYQGLLQQPQQQYYEPGRYDDQFMVGDNWIPQAGADGAPSAAPTSNYDPSFYTNRLAALGIADNPSLRSYFETAMKRPGMDPFSAFAGAQRTAESDLRTRLGNQLESALPQGYERNTLADTVDDTVVANTVNRQYKDAKGALQAAISRGTLNTAGQGAAKQAYRDAYSNALTKATGLGQGVIDKYRTQLGGDVTNFRDRVAGAGLGSNIDVGAGVADINARAADYLARVPREVKSAISDQQFFDTGALLGKSAANQGMVNPGAAQGLVVDPAKKAEDEQQRRVRSTQGVF